MNYQSPFAHLRPTTTPEMLDRAYTVAMRFWPLLWGAGFLAGADHLLAVIMLQSTAFTPSDPARVAIMLSIGLLGDFAAAIALLSMFQGLIFPLRPVSAKAIVRTALRKFPGYFLTHLAWVILVAFCAIFSIRLFSTALRSGAVGPDIFLAVLMALAAATFGVRLCLAPIACLIEDSSPPAAFKRSWHLTSSWPTGLRLRKDRPAMRLAAIIILPALTAMVVMIIGITVGTQLFGVGLPQLNPPRPVTTMMELTGFFATGFAMPLVWAGLMALYVEYRMRLEALDFYLRLRELSRETPRSQHS